MLTVGVVEELFEPFDEALGAERASGEVFLMIDVERARPVQAEGGEQTNVQCVAQRLVVQRGEVDVQPCELRETCRHTR